MRFSYLGIGIAGTTAYAFGILIPGIIFMSKDGQTSDAARQVLDEATANYTAANNAYLADEARLANAQESISSANCYVNQYQGFVSQLGRFCSPAAAYTNSITTLDQSYKVQIITQPPTSDTNSYLDYEYYYVTVERCTTNNEGKKTCKDVRDRRTHYFTVVKTTYSNYGTLIVGDGVNLNMGCSLYEHNIAVATNTWQKSTTGMNLHIYTYDLRTYQETKTYTSTVSANIKVDNQPRDSSNEIATSTNNFMQIATQTLDQIDRQCKDLNSSLKNPQHYVDIVISTTESLPGIREDIEKSKDFKDQMAAIRDSKQAAFDSVDAVYRQTLVNWLLPFFLPTTAFIVLLCIFKESLKDKFVDTQDCCKPSIKTAIPVAMRALSFRSRKNNSRTNVDGPVWVDAEQRDAVDQQGATQQINIETAVEVMAAATNVPNADLGASVVAPPMTFSNYGANVSPFSSKDNNSGLDKTETDPQEYYNVADEEVKNGNGSSLAYI